MNGSVIVSTLTFRPMPDDDGTTLKCEGSNPRLPNSALEDSIVLTVMCKQFILVSIFYVSSRRSFWLADLDPMESLWHFHSNDSIFVAAR